MRFYIMIPHTFFMTIILQPSNKIAKKKILQNEELNDDNFEIKYLFLVIKIKIMMKYKFKDYF